MEFAAPLIDELNTLETASEETITAVLAAVDAVIAFLENVKNGATPSPDQFASLVEGLAAVDGGTRWAAGVNKFARTMDRRFRMDLDSLDSVDLWARAPAPSDGVFRPLDVPDAPDTRAHERAIFESIQGHLARRGQFDTLDVMVTEASGSTNGPGAANGLRAAANGISAANGSNTSNNTSKDASSAISAPAFGERLGSDAPLVAYAASLPPMSVLLPAPSASGLPTPPYPHIASLDTTAGLTPIPLIPVMHGLHAILARIRRGIFDSALQWVTLRPSASATALEFCLRTAEYIALLLRPTPALAEAQAYAAKYFAPSLIQRLAPNQREMLSSLVTLPLYVPLNVDGPYAELVSPFMDGTAIEGLCADFTSAYLTAHDLAAHSPLLVAAGVGANGAISRFLRVKNVMKESHTEWTTENELPVELPLPPEFQFHSVFACPVSKEQATDENPAMMLKCGHVISKTSVLEIAKSLSSIKCPYCPVVTDVRKVLQVIF